MDSLHKLSRRQALATAIAGTAAWFLDKEAIGMNEQSNSGLARTSPGSVGVASEGVLRFLDAVEEKVGGLHSFMLVRHGKVAAEGWWRPYAPRSPHMLFSLSKSFTSTAVGLAVSEGRLTVEDRVVDFFPEQAPASPNANLRAMRVKHLLTMTTGHDQDTLDRTVRANDRNWVRAFLSLPVEHEPGTHFVYNSGATYMLSAIIQKLTGTRLLDYLTPRLFAPLGIHGMTWETCPMGIDTGGWGLSIKTEDIARFGLLYLQQGLWRGRRIVPAEWIEKATAKQVSNGQDPNSDWAQGYGYQFWRCRHGAYRGDGAFGQYCIVMPEQDAILAITSGVTDMQAVLNAVWDHLLPAMSMGKTKPADADERLRRRLAALEIPLPASATNAPATRKILDQTYRITTNDRGITAARLTIEGDRLDLMLSTVKGAHRISAGERQWVRGTTSLDGTPSAKIASRWTWTDAATLVLTIAYYETPFVRTMTIRSGDEIQLSWRDNVGFGPTQGPSLTGKVDRHLP